MAMEKGYVVYVDDDYEDQALLQESFKEISTYKLLCLFRGKELFELLSEAASKVCLIVLDINMPQSGVDILLELKVDEEYKKIPVVMLSTSTETREKEIINGLGADIVKKPNSYSGIRTLAEKLISYC